MQEKSKKRLVAVIKLLIEETIGIMAVVFFFFWLVKNDYVFISPSQFRISSYAIILFGIVSSAYRIWRVYNPIKPIKKPGSKRTPPRKRQRKRKK